MNPIELLRSTQRAVAPQEMLNMHDNLKELRQQQKVVQAQQTADQNALINLEGRQRMQEADVQRMREREQIKENVRLMEAVRPFAKYRGARNRHLEAKNKRKEAAAELKRLEEEVEPALRAVNSKKTYYEMIQMVVKEKQQLIEKADRAAVNVNNQVETLGERGEEYSREQAAEAKNGREYRQRIARTEQAIARLKKQMEEEPPNLDIASYTEKIVGWAHIYLTLCH